jgi:hypothetical protein
MGFVQGKKFDLTDATVPGDPYLYPGEIPSVGLGDVSEGETIQFLPETRVTLDLPQSVPLSIFTFGKEIDECGYEKEYTPTLPKNLVEIFNNPQLDWYTPITQYIDGQNSSDCPYGGSEVLGTIVKFYEPPGLSYEPIGWGAGSHTNVVSDKGDYTLRYSIAVVPPPGIQSKQGTFDTNNFSTTNNFQGQLNNDFATKANNNFSSGTLSPSK